MTGSSTDHSATVRASAATGEARTPAKRAASSGAAMVAARWTLGSSPTSHTYAATTAPATTRRGRRRTPASSSGISTAPRISAMFAPETATRCEIPARRIISSLRSLMPSVSPVVIPRTRAASSAGRWAVASRACCRRAWRADCARPAMPDRATGRTSVARRITREPLTVTVPRTWAVSPSRTRSIAASASPSARTSTGREPGSGRWSRPIEAAPCTVRARICSPSRDQSGPPEGGAGSAAATTLSSTISPSAAASSSRASVPPWRSSAGNRSTPASTTIPRWA